jgi:hypothetical protein
MTQRKVLADLGLDGSDDMLRKPELAREIKALLDGGEDDVVPQRVLDAVRSGRLGEASEVELRICRDKLELKRLLHVGRISGRGEALDESALERLREHARSYRQT